MGDPESIVKKGHRGEDPGPEPDFARPPGGNLDNRMEGEAGGQTVRDVVREIVVNVVTPARISVRAVRPRFSISKKSTRTAAMVLFLPARS
jgi:hypothetical protein